MKDIILNDIPFVGDAMITLNGQVIWTNRYDGDCPPDLCTRVVKCMYVVDNIMVFDIEKGE